MLVTVHYVFTTGFTGVDPKAPYENPKKPELILDTVKNTIEETVNCVIGFLTEKVSLSVF